MSTYFVGDIHGCYKQLQLLLKKVQFNSNIDELWTTGDLVARGPNSIDVLRYIYSLGKSAKIVLGNHDLYLIKAYLSQNIKIYEEEYMLELFDTNDISSLINWLKSQPLLRVDEEKKIILSHAGIPPIWDVDTAKLYAQELEKILYSNNDLKEIFNLLESNDKKIVWNSHLKKINKIKFIINGFTRMRYCDYDGNLDMVYKEYPLSSSTVKLKPWFLMIDKIPKEFAIIFGHWASLNGMHTPKRFFALDTGCSWGKHLTMLRWEDKKKFFQNFYE